MESCSPWVPDGGSVTLWLDCSRQKQRHLTHICEDRLRIAPDQTRWISLNSVLGVTLSSSFLQTLPPLVPACGSDYQAHMDWASCPEKKPYISYLCISCHLLLNIFIIYWKRGNYPSPSQSLNALKRNKHLLPSLMLGPVSY